MNNTIQTNPSDCLNDLLARAYDAEQGFALAAEHAENSALRDWFNANSRQRLTFGDTLKRHLADLEVEPDKGPSITGKLHQAFMKLRAALSSENDLALIEECRRGEKQALEDYQDALKCDDLRTDARKTLNDQAQYLETQLEALGSIEAALSIKS